MQTTRPHLEVNSLLLEYQRKRWLLGLSSGTDTAGRDISTNYAEEGVLLSLFSTGERNVKELSEELGIERSWMSRIISGLEERKLIKSNIPEFDKRSKQLKLSPKGRELFLTLSSGAARVIDIANADLSETEKRQLSNFLQTLADGLGAAKITGCADLHPIYLQLWRISRAVGITGENFMQTGLSLTQIHVIHLLAIEDAPPIARELDRMLPFDVSTVSRTISAFEKMKLISREPSSDDRRRMDIVLTKEGQRKIEEIKKAEERIMRQALDKVSSSELHAALSVLRKVATGSPILPARALKDRAEIRKLSIGAVDQLGELLSKPERALVEKRAENSTIYGMFVDSKAKGLVVVEDKKGEQGLEVLFLGSGLSDRECVALLRSSLGKLSR